MCLPHRKELNEFARRYFDYMAEHFPVMCASDEFYLFPRAKRAIHYLDRLDSLDQDKITQNISDIKGFLAELKKAPSENLGLEERIDIEILTQNMLGFLREYDEVKVWQRNPNLYLKISLVGLEHVISRQVADKAESAKMVLGRLKAIPEILRQGINNLAEVPVIYREAALEMCQNSLVFFKDIISGFIKEKFNNQPDLFKAYQKVLTALKDFEKFLKSVSTTDSFAVNEEFIQKSIRESYGYQRSVKEIYQICQAEYDSTLSEMVKVSQDIDADKDWKQILLDAELEEPTSGNILELYIKEVRGLKSFLQRKDILSSSHDQGIRVMETPVYMRPLRAFAAYSAPITGSEPTESGVFYITIPEKGMGKNFLREYHFETAHETYPGHHLLDTNRRWLANPIRQQIESPLFYEGWACYGEQLIDESGYLNDARERLIRLKRQLRRALRAIVDLDLHLNKLGLKEAVNKLNELYLDNNPERTYRAVRQYLLAPGYQLCYTVGKYEILRLREKFGSQLGLKRFHNVLLEGGEIPFAWVAKRLEIESSS